MELDSFAVDHDWMPFSKGTSDVVAVGFADGSIKPINKSPIFFIVLIFLLEKFKLVMIIVEILKQFLIDR